MNTDIYTNEHALHFIGKWLKWRGFVQFTLSSFTWWIIILCSHEECDTVTPMHSFNTSRPPLILWPNPWLIYFNLSLWYRPHEWHRGNKFGRRNCGKWNGNTDECALVLIKQQPKKPPKNTLQEVIMAQGRTALYSNVIPLGVSMEHSCVATEM